VAGIRRWGTRIKTPGCGAEAVGRADPPPQENPMSDLVVLALGLAFFALTLGYAVACDRL
jgi:hypothetical protein